MNEIQFLRAQLATELRHLEAVATLCSTALGHTTLVRHTTPGAPASEPQAPLLKACADYLVYGVRALASRDHARLNLNYARNGQADQAGDPLVRDFATALGDAAKQWAEVETELATAAAQANADLYKILPQLLHGPVLALGQALSKRPAAAGALNDSGFSVEEWRRMANVTANSMLDERKLFAEAQRHGR